MKWTWMWVCSATYALLLASCVTTPPAVVHQTPATGDASWRAVEAPDVGRYQLSPGQVATGATAAVHRNPVYPPTQLGVCPAPVEVTALLIVGITGKVRAVRVLSVPAQNGIAAAFVDAARAAALQWQFEPLAIADWVTDSAGNSHRVNGAARPFSAAYVFRFECHAGRGTVSANANPAAGH